MVDLCNGASRIDGRRASLNAGSATRFASDRPLGGRGSAAARSVPGRPDWPYPFRDVDDGSGSALEIRGLLSVVAGGGSLGQTPAMARSRDGVEIAYEVHGDGDGAEPLAVVLVHGCAGNRTYWDNQVDYLSHQCQVVTIDFGGHGESGLGRGDWNLPAFGNDVVAVVEELDLSNVALVGHSMGGDAILFAARQLGDRVAGLVWVDVVRSLGDEPVSSSQDVEAFLAPFVDDFEAATARFARSLFPSTADPAVVARVSCDMAASPRDAALGSLRHALNREPAMLDALERITAPVVAINPDIQPTDVDSMRRHGVEPTILKGVGHYSMIEAPEQFDPLPAETMQSFTRSRRRRLT